MTKVPMIATKPFTYAGVRLSVGSLFDARGAADARLLSAIKKAAPAPAVAPAEEPVPAPVQTPAKAPTRGRRANTYNRRDMVAASPLAAAAAVGGPVIPALPTIAFPESVDAESVAPVDAPVDADLSGGEE